MKATVYTQFIDTQSQFRICVLMPIIGMLNDVVSLLVKVKVSERILSDLLQMNILSHGNKFQKKSIPPPPPRKVNANSKVWGKG